jgi:hypothetical protein
VLFTLRRCVREKESLRARRSTSPFCPPCLDSVLVGTLMSCLCLQFDGYVPAFRLEKNAAGFERVRSNASSASNVPSRKLHPAGRRPGNTSFHSRFDDVATLAHPGSPSSTFGSRSPSTYGDRLAYPRGRDCSDADSSLRSDVMFGTVHSIAGDSVASAGSARSGARFSAASRADLQKYTTEVKSRKDSFDNAQEAKARVPPSVSSSEGTLSTRRPDQDRMKTPIHSKTHARLRHLANKEYFEIWREFQEFDAGLTGSIAMEYALKVFEEAKTGISEEQLRLFLKSFQNAHGVVDYESFLETYGGMSVLEAQKSQKKTKSREKRGFLKPPPPQILHTEKGPGAQPAFAGKRNVSFFSFILGFLFLPFWCFGFWYFNSTDSSERNYGRASVALLFCTLIVGGAVGAAVVVVSGQNYKTEDVYHCVSAPMVLVSLKLAGRDAKVDVFTDHGTQVFFRLAIWRLFHENVPVGFNKGPGPDTAIFLDDVIKLNRDPDLMTVRTVFRIKVSSMADANTLVGLMREWVMSRKILRYFSDQNFVFTAAFFDSISDELIPTPLAVEQSRMKVQPLANGRFPVWLDLTSGPFLMRTPPADRSLFPPENWVFHSAEDGKDPTCWQTVLFTIPEDDCLDLAKGISCRESGAIGLNDVPGRRVQIRVITNSTQDTLEVYARTPEPFPLGGPDFSDFLCCAP